MRNDTSLLEANVFLFVILVVIILMFITGLTISYDKQLQDLTTRIENLELQIEVNSVTVEEVREKLVDDPRL